MTGGARRRAGRAEFACRWAALTVWGDLVWTVLTWTLTLEQVAVGLVASGVTAILLAPLGAVVRPWKALAPRRFVALLIFAVVTSGQVVVANAKLTRRVWMPSRPLSSGVVVVPTSARTDAGLALVGLVSSLIVDNQIVTLDRASHTLAYHAVAVPPGDRDAVRDAVNGPVERFLPHLLEQRS